MILALSILIFPFGNFADGSTFIESKALHNVPYNSGHLPVMVTRSQGESKGAVLLHGGNDSYFEELFFPRLYLAQKICRFTLKNIAGRIDQDVLIIGANKDHFIMPYLFHEEYDLLQNARTLTLRLLTDKQDAGAHRNVGNSKLALDSIIKWIECCTE